MTSNFFFFANISTSYIIYLIIYPFLTKENSLLGTPNATTNLRVNFKIDKMVHSGETVY
jgi:hypothetical protein